MVGGALQSRWFVLSRQCEALGLRATTINRDWSNRKHENPHGDSCWGEPLSPMLCGPFWDPLKGQNKVYVKM